VCIDIDRVYILTLSRVLVRYLSVIIAGISTLPKWKNSTVTWKALVQVLAGGQSKQSVPLLQLPGQQSGQQSPVQKISKSEIKHLSTLWSKFHSPIISIISKINLLKIIHNEFLPDNVFFFFCLPAHCAICLQCFRYTRAVPKLLRHSVYFAFQLTFLDKTCYYTIKVYHWGS
jgi:hypothetical protein